MRATVGALLLTALFAAGALCAAGAAGAQEVEVRVDRRPHYAGSPIRIQLTATGFEDEPAPEVEVPAPGMGQLELRGVSPNVSSSIRIIGGKVERRHVVNFVYNYVFLAQRAGDVSIGPFRVHQGATERTTQTVNLRIADLPGNRSVGVELTLPASRVYVGARVPVTLRFTISKSLRDDLQGYVLSVPFFASSEFFRFLDEPVADPDMQVRIQTGDETLELPGTIRGVERNGEPAIEISVERTLVPLRTGSYTVAPASIVVNEGTGWRRDLFGRREATRVRKWRMRDQARTLAVDELPAEDRPASFAGAVGRGFHLEATADRTVVQVGDPITLTLTLRGEGLETASLPRLDAEGLLPASRFRVPPGELAGSHEGDAKRFTATVRVLDESVDEIPPLEYAWFDPTTLRYETTRSRPIALSVKSAEIIGAAQVERDARGAADSPANDVPELGPTTTGTVALTGADLAIERDPARLLRDGRLGLGGPWLAGGLYGVGALFVVLAVWDRRRRNVDPETARQQARLEAAQREVREAISLGDAECARAMAGALRRMLAERPEARTRELDEFLGECDARSYAPPGQAAAADDAFRQHGEELARRLMEEPR